MANEKGLTEFSEDEIAATREKAKHPAPKGAQRRMFEQVAVGNCCPPGDVKTRRALVEKGLIVQTGFRYIGNPPFQVKLPEFEVPIHHHMEWCKWCSEQAE